MSKTIFTAILVLASAAAIAQQKVDIFPKDNRSYSEKEQARNWEQARKGHETMQREKQVESMRDKTHDGRLSIGRDLSVGGEVSPPRINVRTTTK